MGQNLMEQQSEMRVATKVPCEFCKPGSQEIRLILKAAYLRIRLLKQKFRGKARPRELLHNSDGLQSMQRFLNMLFGKQKFGLKLSRSCGHLPLFNLLRAKLEVRPQEMQALICEFCDLLARRNYELELVTLQIKNVEESVALLGEGGETISEKRETASSVEVKVEEGRVEREVVGWPQVGNRHQMVLGNLLCAQGRLLPSRIFFQ